MFLGHINDIKDGEYTVLQQCGKKKILVNNQNEYSVVSNVCTHQKSIISTSDGSGSRVCPYHGWSYSLEGNSLGSGTTMCKNSVGLTKESVYQWNNLLFTEPLNLNYSVDLSNMILTESRTDIVNCDYRNVMDLFLDVDHIPIVHKGVYEKIGLSNIREVSWQYFDNGSLQIVSRNDNSFDNHLIDSEQNHGAFWLAIYPNTMIEWQPGSLFITVSLGDNKVQVFKYRDTRYTIESFEINDMVWETAWSQDKEQCELLTEFTEDHLCTAKTHYRSFLNGTS